VEKEVLKQVFFFRILIFSPVNTILPSPHTDLYVHVSLAGSTNGRSLGPSKNNAVSEIGDRCIERNVRITLVLNGLDYLHNCKTYCKVCLI
jgi:hypothetical protein